MPHKTADVRTYYIIFGILMLLLLLTIGASWLDLGRANFIVAVLIAAVKATLITLYFMHLRDSTPLTKLVAFAGLLFLVILFSLAFTDYWSRLWLSPRKLGGEDVGPG